MKVFVLSQYGKPLMPTRPQKARKLLEQGKAIVVKRSPFTIKLNYQTGESLQPVTLGVDAGYAHVGFSAVTTKEELLGGEFNLLKGMSERLYGPQKRYLSGAMKQDVQIVLISSQMG